MAVCGRAKYTVTHTKVGVTGDTPAQRCAALYSYSPADVRKLNSAWARGDTLGRCCQPGTAGVSPRLNLKPTPHRCKLVLPTHIAPTISSAEARMLVCFGNRDDTQMLLCTMPHRFSARAWHACLAGYCKVTFKSETVEVDRWVSALAKGCS